MKNFVKNGLFLLGGAALGFLGDEIKNNKDIKKKFINLKNNILEKKPTSKKEK